MDCLFCRFPDPNHPVSHWHKSLLTHFTVTGFLIHSSYPLGWIRGSSRSIGLSELHWFVRDRACFLLEGERSWEIFLGFARSCTKPPPWQGPPWEARRAYLSFFTFVGTGLSWRYCMWRMEAIGRRWDSFNVGLPGPAAAPRGSGRGLLSRSRGSPL